MRKQYQFISDDSHGWLEVPQVDLHDLRIEQTISQYSFIGYRDNTLYVYLEEDSDAPRFSLAYFRINGERPTITETHISGRSSIREFSRYAVV